jgi:AcrR family transcriptional regulator
MSSKASRSAPGGGKGRKKPRKAAQQAAPSAAPDGKRERNKAHNRAEILSAAREVFTELGYDAATVRDIIRRTELASGTFYNYFPDKESVFRALLRESEERRLDWLSKVERRGGGYEEYLHDTFRAYFEFVVSDRTTFDLLQRNSQTLRSFSRDPVIVDEHDRLRRVLLRAMQAHALPHADAGLVAAAILGVCFEIAVITVERSPVDIDAATQFVTDLFLGFFARVRKSGATAPT